MFHVKRPGLRPIRVSRETYPSKSQKTSGTLPVSVVLWAFPNRFNGKNYSHC